MYGWVSYVPDENAPERFPRFVHVDPPRVEPLGHPLLVRLAQRRDRLDHPLAGLLVRHVRPLIARQ